MQFRNAPPGKCSGRRSSCRGSRQRVGGVGSSDKRWGGSNAAPLLQPRTWVARLFEGRRPATPAVGVARLLCRSGHDRFVAQVRIQPAHQALAARKRPRVCMLRVAARMRPGSSEGRGMCDDQACASVEGRQESDGTVAFPRFTRYALRKRGLFPPSVRIGRRAVGWFGDEILDHLKSRPRVGARPSHEQTVTGSGVPVDGHGPVPATSREQRLDRIARLVSAGACGSTSRGGRRLCENPTASHAATLSDGAAAWRPSAPVGQSMLACAWRSAGRRGGSRQEKAGDDVEERNPGRTAGRGEIAQEPARRDTARDRGDRRSRCPCPRRAWPRAGAQGGCQAQAHDDGRTAEGCLRTDAEVLGVTPSGQGVRRPAWRTR